MPPQAEVQAYGRVFNEVAEDYDRHRPSYPDELIDRVCAGAGLRAGDAVLELACGTGQLTRSLLARGLSVTAVEPGERLLARARHQLAGAGDVELVDARFEDAVLPRAHYSAVFSASAIHWIDPDVGWGKAADALVDGGLLALISYFGLEDAWSAGDQQALRAVMSSIAPELAAEWPTYRDLDAMLDGVAERRGNVSEVWAWLGEYAIVRRDAAALFDEAQVVALPRRVEHTAEELTALLGTMSFWARLGRGQREALGAENRALEQRLGRPIRSSTVACLVTARRKPRAVPAVADPSYRKSFPVST